MYPSVHELVELGDDSNDDRPIILCEYSHSMGNSNGNIHLYFDQFWGSNTRHRGGFIWDFKDQGLRKRCMATGREYFAYGGDFNEVKHDAQFCINGLFSPDRVPHPAVDECRYLQQPVKLSPTDGVIKLAMDNGRVQEVELSVDRQNKSFLNKLDWEWSIICDRLEPIARGSFEVSFDQPTTIIRLDGLQQDEFDLSLPQMYWLNLVGRMNNGTKWCMKGHVVVTEQYEIEYATASKKPHRQGSLKTHGRPHKVEESSSQLIVSTPKYEIALDKESGVLKGLSSHTAVKNMFLKAVSPNFTRADTDNDRGGVDIVRSFFDYPIIIDIAFF